jgi:hypothetical protein
MKNYLSIIAIAIILISCQKNTVIPEPECSSSNKFEFTQNGQKSIFTYDDDGRVLFFNYTDGTKYTYEYKSQEVSIIINNKYKYQTFGLSKSYDLQSIIGTESYKKGFYEYDSDNHLIKCQTLENTGISAEYDQLYYTTFDWKAGNMLMSKVYGKSGSAKEQLRRYIKYEYDIEKEAQTDHFYTFLFSKNLHYIYDGGIFNDEMPSQVIRTGKSVKNLVKRRLAYLADGTLYNEDVYEYEIDKYKRITSVKVTSTNTVSVNNGYKPTVNTYTFNYLCK